jgi:FixJ family two-component response regulator
MNTLLTIYLVDNDRSARKGLLNLLTAAGYKVETFTSLQDFLQIQPTDHPACLIMDTQVPDVPGMNLLTVFSQENINMPVIFLSASDDRISRKRAADAKARKPVDGHALLDAIAWQIEIHSRNDPANEEASEGL